MQCYCPSNAFKWQNEVGEWITAKFKSSPFESSSGKNVTPDFEFKN